MYLFIISSKFSPPVFLVISSPLESGILNIPIVYPIKAKINVITIPTKFKFNNLKIKENGNNIILRTFFTIDFINVIIFTFIFITYELKNIIYIIVPSNMPKNMNNLISPLLNVNVKYKIMKPS